MSSDMMGLIWVCVGFVFSLLSTLYESKEWDEVDTLIKLLAFLLLFTIIWPVPLFFLVAEFLGRKRKFWFHKK
ncbi:hypothetical protein M0R04_04925 [Candidatus Dojkabacteria bacterium]|jgi:hypothetical protein|nr:hypothetical protein [Candidatus Dojkabacteria bacterium]